MKRAKAILLVAGLALGLALMGAAPARAFAAEDEASEYSIFYSPPERLDALFWAIVDCYPVRDLAEGKAWYLKNAAELKAEVGPTGKYTPPDFSKGPLWLDEERFAALEGDYGDMPEYWQARYFFERVRTGQVNNDFLERACEVAPDDPASAYFLADARRRQAESRMEDVEDPFAEQLKRREAMREAADVMVSCAKREPQNAFYYYEAAFVIRKLGEYERVTELLQLGNSAPVNECVQLFPQSYIVRNLREIREQDDGSGKFRLLSFALINAPQTTQDFVELREMINEYQVIVSLSGDVELLNVLHVFACRYGQQRYSQMLQQLVAVVLVGMITDVPKETGAIRFDEDTLRSLSRMSSLRGAMKGLVMSRREWCNFLRDEGFTEGVPVAYSFSAVPPTPEDVWNQYVTWWEAQILDYLYMGPQIARQFEKMEMYCYQTDGAITRRGRVQPMASGE